jgi:hypothetical protein
VVRWCKLRREDIVVIPSLTLEDNEALIIIKPALRSDLGRIFKQHRGVPGFKVEVSSKGIGVIYL